MGSVHPHRMDGNKETGNERVRREKKMSQITQEEERGRGKAILEHIACQPLSRIKSMQSSHRAKKAIS